MSGCCWCSLSGRGGQQVSHCLYPKSLPDNKRIDKYILWEEINLKKKVVNSRTNRIVRPLLASVEDVGAEFQAA